ncbi:endonuclease/exonuclease/phosphatase family protein [Roseivirga seohaensis]|uniref:endonuclease/exonuclease/phosphatase family protein n=1 Tax=Roseivirga seohaensis TaxID=1914963 RepID=UPI003BA92CC4
MNYFRSLSFLFVTLFIGSQLSAQAPDSSRIVRVLTYNILHGKTLKGDFDLDLIASVISKEKPDLVALQEVDYKTNRSKKFDLVTELGIRTNMSPLFARAMYYDGGEYGEGILSNFTFLTTKNHPLPYTEGKEPRAAAEVNVVIKSGDTIRFVGTHLDHEADGHNRFIQAEEVNRVLKRDGVPTILVGDLNETPENRAMQLLFKDWERSFADNAFTFPSDKPTKKIDYVLFRPAHRWRILEKRVIDERVASDHRPVLVVLELLPDH